MQEIDEGTGNYLAGFTDGEGCFYVGVYPTSNVSLGVQIVPEFQVSQNGERIAILQLFVNILQCGLIKRNAPNSLRDRTWVFVVKRHDDLYKRILPFFQRFPLRSQKQENFVKFKQVVEMMHDKAHLTKVGLREIIEIAFSMNNERYRKRSLSEILQCLKPSETICQDHLDR